MLWQLVPRATGQAVPARRARFGAGEYALVLAVANADKSSSINYNAQVKSRFPNITESGSGTTRAAFRHNYAWNSYWDETIPLSLTTASGGFVLGNPRPSHRTSTPRQRPSSLPAPNDCAPLSALGTK